MRISRTNHLNLSPKQKALYVALRVPLSVCVRAQFSVWRLNLLGGRLHSSPGGKVHHRAVQLLLLLRWLPIPCQLFGPPACDHFAWRKKLGRSTGPAPPAAIDHDSGEKNRGCHSVFQKCSTSLVFTSVTHTSPASQPASR